MKHAISSAVLAAFAFGLIGPVNAAEQKNIQWSDIPTKTITLFYPGQSTYEWLLSPAHKKGNIRVAAGRVCVDCHEGEEQELGDKLVKGGALEPAPIAGKNGTIKLALQAAHDADYVYLRAQWKTNMNREGRMHDYVRFDGAQWKWYGKHRTHKDVLSGAQPALYEDRFSIMLDDGKVPNFAAQGCWLTCHAGLPDTREQAAADVVKKHPLLGDAGLKESEVKKYLPSSRTEAGAWDKTKSAEEIAKIKADGGFLDLMQWRAARSAPAGMADDGYVLEYRNFDAGKNPFSWNLDRKTMTPLYMFDAAKVGDKALRAEDIGNPAKPAAVIRELNAAKFDPNAGWKAGDILPGRLLSRVDAKGSAADNDAVQGDWKDGTYTVTWRRKLNTGNNDDKALKVGGKYTVAFAIHDDNVTTRFHHVSFPVTLGVGADADIKAVTLK